MYSLGLFEPDLVNLSQPNLKQTIRQDKVVLFIY